MKTMRSLFLSLILALGLNSIALAQFDQATDFLKGGVSDAEKLFQGYLKPYANIFGANLNAGWYNTARPHKFPGFDITFTMSAAMSPTADQIFNVSDLKLSSDATISGGSLSPTAAGKKTPSRPTIVYSRNAPAPLTGKVQYASFTLPDGLGLNILPMPMAQLGIGLPKGTDVTVRFVPSIDLGDVGNVGLWGVGLKHSIMQWIPAINKLPFLDITAQGGYTKLNTNLNLNYDPLNVVADVNHDYVKNSNKWLDQKLELGITAWTLNLVVSETIPILCFYQAIGISSSNFNLGLKGNYPFPSIETSVSSPYFGEPVVTNDSKGIIKDPINIEVKNSKNLRLNAGVRIKLGFLTIHADYTKAKYSVLTAGLGISIR